MSKTTATEKFDMGEKTGTETTDISETKGMRQ